ncbi:thioesterase [Acidocella aquatica]|uniref:Thioesterase n=1 Tax=Acidocella aquatica TaxID=1922313 RepID=A0ABQ6A022_9PROT|nr:thioesterase family protein [Acidocella aquatica]GLR65815.1 thioesterase [Acidocella aquatica]
MTSHSLLTDFPSQTYDKLRYGDTDRQGHVNNAVFTTLFETGRIAVLEAGDRPLSEPGYNFVLARITVDYLAEITWPGTVEIGTAVKSVGNSSLTVVQALFQHGRCVATAEAVMVQVDPQARRSVPLSPALREAYNALRLKPAPAR